MSKTFTLCPSSTVASTFNPRQYLQSLEIPKQISCVLRGTKRAIPRKLVKISDCRVSRFLKTVPGCRVSVSFPVSSHQLYPGGRGRLARYLGVKSPSSPFLSFFIFLFLNTRQWRFFHLHLWKNKLVWIVKSFVSYTLSNPDKGPVIIYHQRGSEGGGGGRHAEDFGGDQS